MARQRMWMLLWLLLAAALWLPACGGSTPAPEDRAGAKSPTPVQQEPDETLLPSPEERQGYIRKVEAELKQLDDRIGELKEKAKQASGATRDKLNAAIKELDEKRKLAQEKLDALKAAGTKGWDATKKGTDKAVDEVKKAYERVKSIF